MLWLLVLVSILGAAGARPDPAQLYPPLVLAPQPLLRHAANNISLRQAGAAHGLLMGSCINLGDLQNTSDPMYKVVIDREYAIMTAENECKWTAIEPSQVSSLFPFPLLLLLLLLHFLLRFLLLRFLLLLLNFGHYCIIFVPQIMY